MKNIINILCFLLVVVSIVRIAFTVYLYRSLYLTPYNHSRMSFIYDNSQYIKGPLAKLDISDEGLYAFAGYYYLINMGDVSGVNFENPPLGKYLVGLSILAFRNEYIISLIYGLLFLLITYKLGIFLFNRTVASVSLFLLSFSSIYLEQIKSSLIDLPTALFFITAIFFYLKAKKKTDYLFVSTLLFSLSFITKFFPSLLIVFVILLIDSYREGGRFFRKFLLSLIIAPIVYLLSYTSFFIYHPSLLGFLKYQYWLVKWRSGNPYVIGNIARLILTGRYKSWWDDSLYVKFSEWNIYTLIPLGFFTSGLNFTKSSSQRLTFLIGIIYFLYVFFATTGVEKYLLPTYPIYVIFCAAFIVSLGLKLRETITKHTKWKLTL